MIPEYGGKLKPDEFMDWLVCMENIFAHKPMTEGRKVTFGSNSILQLCNNMWAELQKKRRKRNLNMDPVETWIEKKNLLKQKILPVNYSIDLCSNNQFSDFHLYNVI